jgi:hypothetical protein
MRVRHAGCYLILADLQIRPDRTEKENGMTSDNEQIVRKAYQIAEDKDLKGWVAAFTYDGTFTDESIGVTFRGPDGLPRAGGELRAGVP